MTTMKAFAKGRKDGKVSLAVVNELGMIVSVLVDNGDIDTVLNAEEWFNYSKLNDDQYLIRMARFQTYGKPASVWYIDSEHIADSTWTRIVG